MRYCQTPKTPGKWLVLVLALLVIPGLARAEENKKESKGAPQQHAAPPQAQRQPQPRQQHAAPPQAQRQPRPQHAAPPQPQRQPQPQHAAPQQPQRQPQPQHAAPAPQQHAAPPPQEHAAPQQRGGAGQRPGATAQHPGATAQHPSARVQHPGTTAQHGGAASQQRGPAGKPFTPPHGATATRDSKGGAIYRAKNGTEFHTGPKGQLTSLKTRGGAEARFDANGKVRSIHSGALTINRGARGERVVESRLKEGGRVVVVGGHRGFVERPFFRGEHPYLRRTYVYGGRPYAVVYRGYYYHGFPYYGYVPPYYYAPAFYGWAYHPWPAPLPWRWGWAADPWYGYSGYYFAPYPVYAYPALWLTDFLLAENLRAAYEAQAAATTPSVYVQQNPGTAPPPPPEPAPAPGNANATTLTPETKQAIADEVKVQLAAEQAAANNPQPAAAPSNDQVPEALDPKVRTFIVSNTLSQQTADGTMCSLSSGDVLTRIANTPDANQNVQVLVTSSQTNDCQPGTQLAVSLQDLQDMHNDFRQKIDQGLQTLADNQGKNGMASAPPADPRPLEEGQAQPDTDATAQLDQQQAAADAAETAVRQAQESGQGE